MQDFSPQVLDMSAPCRDVPGNLLQNSSFEVGAGSANNAGQPPSTINGWDGCCNLDNQGLNTTWQVTTAVAHCGTQSLSIVSNVSALGNVLDQQRIIDGGGGKAFRLSAWAQIKDAAPDAQLRVDLYDLSAKVVLAPSMMLGAMQGANGWVPIQASGTLPQGASPMVQARIYNTSKMTAFIDDITLTLP